MPFPVFVLTTALRARGGVLCLATGAMLLPREAMAATNLWLGLEPLVETPLVLYLARSTSGLYALRAASEAPDLRRLVAYFAVT